MSLVGVVLVTTATIFWLLFFPTFWRGNAENPYSGILMFLVLPAAFLLGLAIIPVGAWMARRKHRMEEIPPISLSNPHIRRILAFIAFTTVVNLMVGGQVSFRAVNYMESHSFCGEACHVMNPEFTVFQQGPHASVECVRCHVGPGVDNYIQAKLTGLHQVYSVATNTVERPIPAPVETLRPSREICDSCHWVQKKFGDKLWVVPKYGDDETNTLTRTVLLLHITGGKVSPGIHSAHMGGGVEVHYGYTDAKRQEIAWVEVKREDGSKSRYQAPDAKIDAAKVRTRQMDCIDCHNRASHIYELPERGVDRVLTAGQMSATLPFIKKKGVEILKAGYSSQADAEKKIPAALEDYYQKNYPDVLAKRRAEVAKAGQTLVGVYKRNVFPEMKVDWGTYPNHIGHTDAPGCFRCHDGVRVSEQKKQLTQDCNACHQLVAMDEPAPKVLTDLGVEP